MRKAKPAIANIELNEQDVKLDPNRVRRISKIMHETLISFAEFSNEFKGKRKDSSKMIIEYCEREKLPLEVVSVENRNGYTLAGQTNGKQIFLNLTADNHVINLFSFFHELGHYLLHFDEEGAELDVKVKEIEADSIAVYMCNLIFPGHYDEFVDLARSNPSREKDFNNPFK